MGSRGPVPKRSGQRRRRNKRDEATKAPAGARKVFEGEPPRSGKGSGTDEWRRYAAEELELEVPDGASRGEIIALVDEHRVAGPAPASEDGWHPLVRDWYESLANSGQSEFYEPSDWLTARLLAEAMSRELNPQPMMVMTDEGPVAKMVKMPPKGASLSAWFKAMSSLLITEGDRRRMQVELQRGSDDEGPEQAPAPVTDIRSWREGLSG